MSHVIYNPEPPKPMVLKLIPHLRSVSIEEVVDGGAVRDVGDWNVVEGLIYTTKRQIRIDSPEALAVRCAEVWAANQ